MDIKDFKLGLEYPSVSGSIAQNVKAMLMESYGGRASETTAIMQYAYQSYILKCKYPEISSILEGISIVEMHHHELLADAILYFCGDPIIGGQFSFFSGSYISYVKDVESILYNDIEGEKQAICDYRKIIDKTDNCSLKELLARIIMDEELHVNILSAEYKKLICCNKC